MAKIGRPLSVERSKFNLQVTFSNRLNGIFNKASEFCTLCAAEVAIITFSLGNKVYSFGHSSVNDVIDRILTEAQPQTSSAMQVIEAHHNAIVRNLIAQLTQSSELLDVEKKLSKDMNMLLKPTQGQFWWAGPIDGMSEPQLELLKSAIEEFKRTITLQADMMRIEGSDLVKFFVGTGSSFGPVAPPAA